MAKRTRRADPEATVQPFPLFSLPAELRCLIWKFVGSEVVELYTSGVTTSAPVEALDLKGQIASNQSNQHPFSLRWLRASRLVHSEAKPIVYSNLTIRLKDALVISRFLARTPESIKRLIRSVEFPLKLTVSTDGQDGVFLSRPLGWLPHSLPCHCPSCFWSDQDKVLGHLPSLEEVRLLIYFKCMLYPGNRTVKSVLARASRILANGGTLNVSLTQQKSLPALAVVNDPSSVPQLLDEICERNPVWILYSCNRSESKMKFVRVRADSFHIVHDALNEDPLPPGECWCQKWTIDEETFETFGITKLLEERLANDLGIVRMDQSSQ